MHAFRFNPTFAVTTQKPGLRSRPLVWIGSLCGWGCGGAGLWWILLAAVLLAATSDRPFVVAAVCAQVSAAAREKQSAQDAAAAASARLQQKLTMAQQEVDMLRAAAEIEAAVRKELEETVDEVRGGRRYAHGGIFELDMATKPACD